MEENRDRSNPVGRQGLKTDALKDADPGLFVGDAAEMLRDTPAQARGKRPSNEKAGAGDSIADFTDGMDAESREQMGSKPSRMDSSGGRNYQDGAYVEHDKSEAPAPQINILKQNFIQGDTHQYFISSQGMVAPHRLRGATTQTDQAPCSAQARSPDLRAGPAMSLSDASSPSGSPSRLGSASPRNLSGSPPSSFALEVTETPHSHLHHQGTTLLTPSIRREPLFEFFSLCLLSQKMTYSTIASVCLLNAETLYR